MIASQHQAYGAGRYLSYDGSPQTPPGPSPCRRVRHRPHAACGASARPGGEQLAVIGPSGGARPRCCRCWPVRCRQCVLVGGRLRLNRVDRGQPAPVVADAARVRVFARHRCRRCRRASLVVTATYWRGGCRMNRCGPACAACFYPADIPWRTRRWPRLDLPTSCSSAWTASRAASASVGLARLLVAQARLWLVDEPLSAPRRARQAIATLTRTRRGTRRHAGGHAASGGHGAGALPASWACRPVGRLLTYPRPRSPQRCCASCTPSTWRKLRRPPPGVLDGCTLGDPGPGGHELPLTHPTLAPCPCMHPASRPPPSSLCVTLPGGAPFSDAGRAGAAVADAVWTEFRPWRSMAKRWRQPGHFGRAFSAAATPNFCTCCCANLAHRGHGHRWAYALALLLAVPLALLSVRVLSISSLRGRMAPLPCSAAPGRALAGAGAA